MQTITNSTGQVPKIPGLPTLIDDATPREAYKRTGLDGDEYKLVFSDEFNHDGRTFWPGDDPCVSLTLTRGSSCADLCCSRQLLGGGRPLVLGHEGSRVVYVLSLIHI